MLVCRTGERLFGMPLPHVVETLRPLPLEPIAGTPSFVLGVSVIRGLPVPVLDAGELLGSSAASRHGRYVTLRVDDRRVALAVEEVVGVQRIPASELHALPPLLEDAARDLVSVIGTLDGALLPVLGAARILPAQVWNALELSEAVR